VLRSSVLDEADHEEAKHDESRIGRVTEIKDDDTCHSVAKVEDEHMKGNDDAVAHSTNANDNNMGSVGCGRIRSELYFDDHQSNIGTRRRIESFVRGQQRTCARSPGWVHEAGHTTTDETAHRGLATQHVVGEDLNVREDAWLNLRRAGPTRHGKSSRTQRAGRCGLGDIKNKDMSRGRQEGRAARITKNIATAKN
jgi:hypothetical protein